MSPEYKSINELDHNLKGEARNMFGSHKDFCRATQEGFGFYLEEGGILKILRLSELTEGQKENGRKQKSPWHIIYPLSNPYSQGRKVSRLDEGESLYGKKKHRGKHRSNNRGSLLRKFLDLSPNEKYKRGNG